MSSFEKGGPANMPGGPASKTFSPFSQMMGGQPGLNRDSSEEDVEGLEPYESEINFSDNPTLKDFLNLSNGGGRFIRATQDARRAVVGGSNG